jgi:osmoprotectant transport system permease protein
LAVELKTIKGTFTIDRLALLGCASGILSLALNWFILKPNRLAAGTGYGIFYGAWMWLAIALVAVWACCVVFSFFNSYLFSALLAISANISLILSIFIVGTGSQNLLKNMPDSARVSPSTGMFVAFLAGYIVIFTAVKRLSAYKNRILKNIVIWTSPAAFAMFLFSGGFENISVFVEFTVQKSRFYQEFFNHIYLVAVSVSVGSAIGILLGMLAVANRRAKSFVFFITNITQTIPSLALFGLLIAPLSALSFRFLTLREMGIRGIGNTPAIIALVIYSLLPVVQNTYTSIKQIEPSIIDAAKGIGMSKWQIFKKIEAPLAAPLVMEGIRIASVQSVGLAAVAALIGAGGLGWFIFQGLGQAAPDMILLGTLPIIALAVLTDFFMRMLVKLVEKNKRRGQANN